MAIYDAFISYSHANDKPTAASLQSVVQRLGKSWYRRRSLRLFRDDTSLSATPHLWPTIEQALGNSRFLILMASPEAAASSWVNKEVEYWLAHKSIDTLLIALTAGELVWDGAAGAFSSYAAPLPPALLRHFPNEPKWVDLRPFRGGANPRDSRFIEAGADLAAAIHGIPKEDLLSQEVRQQRRTLTLAWSAAGFLLLLASLAGWQWKVAVYAEQIARRNYEAARDAVEGVIFDTVNRLTTLGLSADQIERVLIPIEGSVETLAETNPGDLDLQRTRAIMREKFARLYSGLKQHDRALAAAGESLTIFRRLAAEIPAEAQPQADLASSLQVVGDIRQAAGDPKGALAAFQESVAILRALVRTNPGEIAWQTTLATRLEALGRAFARVGDKEAARRTFDESFAIFDRVASTRPDQLVRLHNLGVSLDDLGDSRVSDGDLAGALVAFERAVEVFRALVTRAPNELQYQRDLGVSLERVGDSHLALGARARALEAFEESLALRRKLLGAHPREATYQDDACFSYVRIGGVHRSVKAYAPAIAAYEGCLKVRRAQQALRPGAEGPLGGIADMLESIGLIQVEARTLPAALASFRQALAVYRKLAAGDPEAAGYRIGESALLGRIGDVHVEAGDRDGARAAYRDGVGVARKLAASRPDDLFVLASLARALHKLARALDGKEREIALREARQVVAALQRRDDLGNEQKKWLNELAGNIAKPP